MTDFSTLSYTSWSTSEVPVSFYITAKAWKKYSLFLLLCMCDHMLHSDFICSPWSVLDILLFQYNFSSFTLFIIHGYRYAMYIIYVGQNRKMYFE